MVSDKRSRKGKKAWRKNISSAEVHEFIEQTTHQQQRGPAVETLQDDQLFFVDKGRNDADAQEVASGRKRKRREKVLTRSQLIIQAAQSAIPVATVPKRKPKGKLTPAPGSTSAHTSQPARSSRPKQDGPPLNIWEEGASSHPATRKKPTQIQAVEVDLPGSSFNPDAEQHQEALAQLVASEMQRVLRQELAPKAPPASAPDDYEAPRSELDLLQVDEDVDEDEETAAVEAAEPAEIGASAAALEPAAAAAAHVPAAKVAVAAELRKTEKTRKKEKRRREEDAVVEERHKLKQQRRDIDELRRLQQEIEEAEALSNLRQERRQLDRADKAATQPPRLGKIRFQPPTVQVLTSDELSGSLREVRPCFAVVRDRFKSLEKRGLIEPRRLQPKKQRRKQVEYEKGARTEKAEALQAEVDDMRAKNKSTRAVAKKALKH